MSTFPAVAIAVAWPPAWSTFIYWVYRREGHPRAPWWRGAHWTLAAAILAAGYLLPGFWLASACAGVNVLIGAWLWWRSRGKDRSRAAGLLGAKSRALRDALVRRVREVAKPGPVLRPVPGGAR